MIILSNTKISYTYAITTSLHMESCINNRARKSGQPDLHGTNDSCYMTHQSCMVLCTWFVLNKWFTFHDLCSHVWFCAHDFYGAVCSEQMIHVNWLVESCLFLCTLFLWDIFTSFKSCCHVLFYLLLLHTWLVWNNRFMW